MAVQAEEGLWSLGSPDLEYADDTPGEHVTGIVGIRVQAVLIDGVTPRDRTHRTTKET